LVSLWSANTWVTAITGEVRILDPIAHLCDGRGSHSTRVVHAAREPVQAHNSEQQYHKKHEDADIKNARDRRN